MIPPQPGDPIRLFKRVDPPEEVSSIVECFWIVENGATQREEQKIIPDGYPEMIFHYGDPYRIRLADDWHAQQKLLIAGQATRHFFLENTGVSAMLGVKLKPTAPFGLFGINMRRLTDRVEPLEDLIPTHVEPFTTYLKESASHDELIGRITRYLIAIKPNQTSNELVDAAIDLIHRNNGMTSVGEIAAAIGVNERQVERLFSKWIGLGPKMYTRIVRFSHIFRLITDKKISWAAVAQLAGYYDQSHFIKNFQAFTGEDPSAYYFDDENLANFFLKTPREF